MWRIVVIAAVIATIGPGGAAAGELERTLGLDRRIGFATAGPELAPFSYGRPIETIAVPDKLLFPLQATNEALTFYAAYRARNYRAMAAVGAMSAWGGTLRKGIDAVTGSGKVKQASIEDLSRLTDSEIAILGYLWHTDGRSGHELYQQFGDHYVTWADLDRTLYEMEKRGLVVREGSGARLVYVSRVTPADARRAAIASRNPDRIKAVLAVLSQPVAEKSEVSRESRSTGDRSEAD